MRKSALIPLLLLGACTVENDPRNDEMSLEYDEKVIANTAADLGNAAEDAADQIGNAASSAGHAIENEIGDIDVDVDINRNKADDTK